MRVNSVARASQVVYFFVAASFSKFSDTADEKRDARSKTFARECTLKIQVNSAKIKQKK